MTIYNLGNIKGEKGDRGECAPGPTGPPGVGIKSIEQITTLRFKICLTDGSEYYVNYGGSTPTPASMTLTCDVNTLNAGETAHLMAAVYDENHALIPGQIVTMGVYKLSDDSLVESLTVTDEDDGTYTASYLGKHTGQLYIQCSVSDLSDTVNLIDACYYNLNTITSSTTLSISDIPTNFKATFKAKATTSSFLTIGNDSNNSILFGILGLNGRACGIDVKENGSYIVIETDQILSTNVEYEFEYTYIDGVQTLKVNNHTFTVTNSNITSRNYVYYESNGGTLSELLIIPL